MVLCTVVHTFSCVVWHSFSGTCFTTGWHCLSGTVSQTSSYSVRWDTSISVRHSCLENGNERLVVILKNICLKQKCKWSIPRNSFPVAVLQNISQQFPLIVIDSQVISIYVHTYVHAWWYDYSSVKKGDIARVRYQQWYWGVYRKTFYIMNRERSIHHP